jgi:hypothetical protein
MKLAVVSSQVYRLWKGFKKFCNEVGYATDTVFDAIEAGGNIPGNMPTWIAVWIMQKYLNHHFGAKFSDAPRQV